MSVNFYSKSSSIEFCCTSGILNFHEGTGLIRLSVIDSGDSVFVERGENG